MVALTILSTIVCSGPAAADEGKVSKNETPPSQEVMRFGSMGILPKNGTENRAAIDSGLLAVVEVDDEVSMDA